MTTEVTFNNSIENVDYSRDYSYLLNFWHTTKLNKEHEFIKRNGIHPSVITVDKRGVNDVGVREGNSVQTNFYTVFRIFIENMFEKKVKTNKERSTEEWILTYQEPIEGLNSKIYLLMHYAKAQGLTNDIIEFVRNMRYGGEEDRNPSPFKIKLRNKDQLHSKRLLESLEDYEVHAKAEIDNAITREANELMNKIGAYLDLPRPTKKISKLRAPIVGAYVDDVVIEHPITGVPGPRGPVPVPMGTVNTGLNELLPMYRQLNASIQGMGDTRVRFAFILNYAQQGTNTVINRLENSEANYREFMRLTNNMMA